MSASILSYECSQKHHLSKYHLSKYHLSKVPSLKSTISLHTHTTTIPHLPPPFRLHKRLPLSSFFTRAGWKERWRRFKLYITSQLAVALATRHINNWSRNAFKKEAVEMFVDINTRLAARDMTNIMPVCYLCDVLYMFV